MQIKRILLTVLVSLAAGRATAEQAAALVRVSPRDARYFETTDGKSYIPIGLNLIGPPPGRNDAERLAGLERWMGKLGANGGNYIRVWLSRDFYDVDHERAGQFDTTRLANIDAMLALARRHGIRVKMCIEHFREIDPANPRQAWALKALHHRSRGGLAGDMREWLASAEARRQFVTKLEFLARRYQGEPAVFGWELWNEMNAIRGPGDYMDWTRVMLGELRRLFPRHLAMQSLGSFDTDGIRAGYRRLASMEGNDVAQVHRYLDLGARLEVCHGPVDVLAAEAVRELLAVQNETPSLRRPVLLAESGAVEPRHTGPFKLYAKDKAGSILHDVLFAPFFAGAAGSGHCWHWDRYVDANDLWWQIGRFAAAVDGLDPPAEGFQPIQIDHPDLRVYLLKGRRTLIAWCRDKANDWKSELAEDKAPPRRSGLTLSLAPHAPGGVTSARVYDPWANRWSAAAVKKGELTLPDFERSIVVRLALPVPPTPTPATAPSSPPRIVPLGLGYAKTGVNTVIFRTEAVTTLGRTQYAAWYDGEARVMLAKRTLGQDKWQVRRTELTGNVRDAHNAISLGVDGSGVLHVSWDHHNHPLRYVQAREAGSLELTEKMPMTGLDEKRVCYPEFFRLANGDLMFLYRDGGSGNGRTMLNRFDVKTRRWSAVQHPLIDGRGKNNAYTNRLAIDSRGAWHLSWCWRETPDVATNHDVCYARSGDQGKTWTRSDGSAYRLPITEDQAEVAVGVPQNSYLINQTTMTTDDRDRPVIATYWQPEGSTTVQFQVIRLEEGGWKTYQAGTRNGPPPFTTGPGSRRTKVSRPAIAAGADGRIFLLARDNEHGGRLRALWCDNLPGGTWQARDLTDHSLGACEPNYDRELWRRDGVFHVFVQRSGQGDRETPVDSEPQPAGVLEWKP